MISHHLGPKELTAEERHKLATQRMQSARGEFDEEAQYVLDLNMNLIRTRSETLLGE